MNVRDETELTELVPSGVGRAIVGDVNEIAAWLDNAAPAAPTIMVRAKVDGSGSRVAPE
jgi:hypothetical protein